MRYSRTMRYFCVAAFCVAACLLIGSFQFAVAQGMDEAVRMPGLDEIAKITSDPASFYFYSTEALRRALPCFVPDDTTVVPGGLPTQRGHFELKNGASLLWVAVNKTSLFLYTDKGKRFFVLSPECVKAREEAAKNDTVLLLITRRSVGMRAQEQPLYFRLYESGRLEYEVREEFYTDASGTKYVVTKQEVQLSSAEVKELIGVTEQTDFLKASENYASLVRAVDSSVVTTLVYTHRGREKKIVLRNYRPMHPKAESFYPKSLVTLLAKVDALRPKK